MSADSNLETVLTEIGKCGSFQVVSHLLICISSALSAAYIVNFMISDNKLEYRWE